MESFDISRLASEILLFIFLHLDLHQLVLSRRINRQFQEVIDSNQLLWRVFEWIQQDQESFRPALDMFDQKSHHSLEKVSIQENKSKEQDLLPLMQVLQESKRTLIDVELKVSNPVNIRKQATELLTTGRKLRRLVVWRWDAEAYRNRCPLSRLVTDRSRAQKSSYDQLQLLWLDHGFKNVDSKHLKSLVSFAQGEGIDPRECRKLIIQFAETVVHLRLSIDDETSAPEPLSCPNLKIFEGWFSGGVSSFFDAPQLRILVLEEVSRPDLKGFPPSVEEIWLRDRIGQLSRSEEWEPLLHLCPKLRILKLTEQFVREASYLDSFVFTGILEVLEIRSKMAQDGEEIDGVKVVSLEKLILPTSLLKEEELNRAAEVAEEIIDVIDYPEFIEITY